MGRQELTDLVAAFGNEAKEKLAGVGEPEEAIRVPIEHLVSAVAQSNGLVAVLDGEAHLSEISSRPDFAVRVNGAVVGYLEVKAPGVSLEPMNFRGHNKGQWERLKDLPNLIYTNGTEWRLWRGHEDADQVSTLLGGALEHAGSALTPDSNIEGLLLDFLRWQPSPIRSVGRLVSTVAPITRMLRIKVAEQLLIEHANIKKGEPRRKQQFLGLASDWRALLFPDATDDEFANGYAQTVTFALLLARTEDIDLTTTSLHEVGQKLGTEHSLMGRALQLLTEDLQGNFRPTIDLLIRVVGAVEWAAVRKNKDTYLHLYERFLEEYDPELRKETGTYYTPHEVVDQMVRLAEDALVSALGKPKGFLDESVTTIDPAMGTGTFLHAIIERVADTVQKSEGPGAVSGTVSALARRLIGFELQLGSYAVAELRTTDLLRSYDADPKNGSVRSYVTDTLSDPNAAETQLASGLGAISESKRQANKIKASVPVTVVIGNPPYGDKAEGRGGWVESGSNATTVAGKGKSAPAHALLDDFKFPGNGLNERMLKNFYVYFWRWATWKVFESIPTDQAGVVCFITTGAYMRGPGAKGMRAYLRRETDEGWIIDLTPEGIRPEVATRIFPGVAQPLAIGLFVRRTEHRGDLPAPIHYKALSGKQADKFAGLASTDLSTGWADARAGWTDAFLPASVGWDDLPALGELFLWKSPGIAAHRTWVIDPSSEVLKRRWADLGSARDNEKHASELFHDTRDSKWKRMKAPFSGPDTAQYEASLASEFPDTVQPLRYGFRSFDRAWIIPDHRVIHDGRVSLWQSRSDSQVFVIEQHSQHVQSGPGLVFTHLIPDMHHFDNRGGRAVPFLQPDGTANFSVGVEAALTTALGRTVSAEEILAYIAGVVSHSGFTAEYGEELATPGVRIPITTDETLWEMAVELGRSVIWLQTYGERYVDALNGRPEGDVRSGLAEDERPFSVEAVKNMPVSMSFDPTSKSINFHDADGNRSGMWGPVSAEVFNYTVGNLNVIGSWFNYRKATPGGRKSSALDNIHATRWPIEWTYEFTTLLTLLTRLISLGDEQEEVLEAILRTPLVTSEQLIEAGAVWPTDSEARKARPALGTEDGELAIDWDDSASQLGLDHEGSA